jgi:hypothetical protein
MQMCPKFEEENVRKSFRAKCRFIESVPGRKARRDEHGGQGAAPIRTGSTLGPILRNRFGRNLRTKVKMFECKFANFTFYGFQIP